MESLYISLRFIGPSMTSIASFSNGSLLLQRWYRKIKAGGLCVTFSPYKQKKVMDSYTRTCMG